MFRVKTENVSHERRGPPPLRPNDWKALRLILAILPQPYWF